MATKVPTPKDVDKTEAGWASAFSHESESSFGEKFAPSVRIEATALKRPVEGREHVQAIMGAASRIYEALEFTHCAEEGQRAYLEWKARMRGGHPVSGITVLTSDPDGKIVSIAIHHRPLPAMLHFSAMLGRDLAGKIEPGLFYEGPPVTTA
jgi:hypothetical protein